MFASPARSRRPFGAAFLIALRLTGLLTGFTIHHMARTPQELLTKLNASHEAQVDRIEAAVDRAMDSSYRDGDFSYYVSERVPPQVLAELKRRYAGWNITAKEVSGYDPKECEDWYRTTFTFSPTGDPFGR